MPDNFTTEKRSEIMRQIHSENTSPEVRVRKFLYKRGLHYRINVKSLIGKPDIVIRKQMTVIFVHGCFWHGHSCKIGSGNRIPKQNHEYWNKKIEGNIKRDKENEVKLKKLGWNVIKVWECQSISEQSLSSLLGSLFNMKNQVII
jgi:DNA mismatch endonuclease (patch repair protein)